MALIEISSNDVSASDFRQCPAASKSTAGLAWIQTLTLIGILGASTVAAFLGGSLQTAGWMAATTVILMIAMTASGKYVVSAYARKSAEALRAAVPIKWSIDDQGLTYGSAQFTAHTRWERVIDVIEEDDRFVFAISPILNPVLPKRQMTVDQIESLRTLVAQVRADGGLGGGPPAGVD